MGVNTEKPHNFTHYEDEKQLLLVLRKTLSWKADLEVQRGRSFIEFKQEALLSMLISFPLLLLPI